MTDRIPPKMFGAVASPALGERTMQLVELVAKLTALAAYWDGYPDRQVCAGDLRAVLSGRYDPR
jgi:hypothetical protein